MARIRSIKPETFDDPDLNALPVAARWLFVGLWTQVDREGRMEDDYRRMKTRLMPYDTDDLPQLLKLLSPRFITRYSVDGCNYLQVNSFAKHQRFHKDERSCGFPAPNGKSSAEPENPPAKRSVSDLLSLDSGNRVLEAGGAPAPVQRAPLLTNHRSCADHFGPVCVPAFWHDKARRKWGKDEVTADRELRAWYHAEGEKWDGKPIGDSDLAFLDARLSERLGTTRALAAPAEPVIDYEAIKKNLDAREAARRAR